MHRRNPHNGNAGSTRSPDAEQMPRFGQPIGVDRSDRAGSDDRQCARFAARARDPQFAGNPRQRPAAARQQGDRLRLELIRKLTPFLAHSTLSRSHRSLSKVSTDSGEAQTVPCGFKAAAIVAKVAKHPGDGIERMSIAFDRPGLGMPERLPDDVERGAIRDGKRCEHGSSRVPGVRIVRPAGAPDSNPC
jgi:hypothetical protein